MGEQLPTTTGDPAISESFQGPADVPDVMATRPPEPGEIDAALREGRVIEGSVVDSFTHPPTETTNPSTQGGTGKFDYTQQTHYRLWSPTDSANAQLPKAPSSSFYGSRSLNPDGTSKLFQQAPRTTTETTKPQETTRPQAEQTAAQETIESREKRMRSYFMDRLSGVADGQDPAELGYEGASLAELEYAAYVLAHRRKDTGVAGLMSLAQVRQERQKPDHFLAQFDGSFDAIEQRMRDDEANLELIRNLYKEAEEIYGAEALESAGYNWATSTELNDIIREAHASRTKPFLSSGAVRQRRQAEAAARGQASEQGWRETTAAITKEYLQRRAEARPRETAMAVGQKVMSFTGTRPTVN